MLQTKLIEVLKTYSTDDLRSFEDYISSPYFNKSKGVVNLYKIIEKFAPDFENKKLTKEKIFEKLYPGRSYCDARIRNLTSDLYKLCEGFIALQGIKKDAFFSKKYLRKELLNRRLDKLFLANLRKGLYEVNNEQIMDENYFYKQSLLNEESTDYATLDSAKMYGKEIQKFHDYSVHYFLVRVLRIYILLLYTKSYTIDFNYELGFLDEIISHLKKHSYEHIPIINIYYNILLLLKEGSDSYYYSLEKLLDKHYDELGADDRYGMYFHLINYCIAKISSDKKDEVFDRNLFKLYKTIIDRKIYRVYEFQYLDHILFSNIVTHALKIKEFKWVENFMNVYKDELAPEHILNTYHICYASLFVYKGEWGKALELLRKIKTSDHLQEIKIKLLMMKIYYELDYFDTITSLSDTFKHFLSKNKFINSRYKLIHMNFINFVGKLVKIKEGTKTTGLSYVRKDILSSKNLTGKDWLLEKINELNEKSQGENLNGSDIKHL